MKILEVNRNESELCVPPPLEEPDVHLGVKDVGHDPIVTSEINDLDNCGFTSVIDRYLMFSSPATPKGTVVNVYDDCYSGSCQCIHKLAGHELQIKPCRVASVMFDNDSSCSDDEWKLFVGLTDGFDIVESETIPEYDCSNYNSILLPEYKVKMDRIISSELANGMLSEVTEKPHCIHALGAVPKPDGGMRPITDCSRPEGNNVNSNISSLVEQFKFKSVDNVVDYLHEGEFMAVSDIKNAYRSVPINPDHSKFQGIRWEVDAQEKWFVDRRLCFGLRCGPYYLYLLSEFIANTMVRFHNMRIVNYLDDFLVTDSSFDLCQESQNKVITFLRFLGLHISWAKVTPPSQITNYLGVTIDSVKMELRLPPEKLDKLNAALEQFSGKKSATKKQIEKLAGILSHCATVVRGGRTFCRRVYDACKLAASNKSKCVRLSVLVRDDIKWWQKFAAIFNGKAAIPQGWFNTPVVSDSSKLGFAAFTDQDWLCGNWKKETMFKSVCGHVVSPPSCDCYDPDNINVLELWPIVCALHRWCNQMKNFKVELVTDNMQVLYMLKTGRSKNVTCMYWLRELFWVCLVYNITLSPTYIRSEDNVVADVLSRLKYPEYASKVEEVLCGFDFCCKNELLSYSRSVAEKSQEESCEV